MNWRLLQVAGSFGVRSGGRFLVQHDPRVGGRQAGLAKRHRYHVFLGCNGNLEPKTCGWTKPLANGNTQGLLEWRRCPTKIWLQKRPLLRDTEIGQVITGMLMVGEERDARGDGGGEWWGGKRRSIRRSTLLPSSHSLQPTRFAIPSCAAIPRPKLPLLEWEKMHF